MRKASRVVTQYYDKKLKDLDNIIIFNRDYNSIVPHIYPIQLGDVIIREDLQSTALINPSPKSV